MIAAVLFPPKSDPVSDATVTAAGDSNGVMVSIDNHDGRWDIYLPTDSATQLIYRLHSAVMDALVSEDVT